MPQDEPRVEGRTRALIKAQLRGGGPDREACILDISTRGLLATAPKPPPRGEFIELLVGRHTIVGHVKWASARRFGVALHERISIAALLSGETGPIALKASRAAQRRKGSLIDALTGNLRNLGQFVQYGIMALAVAGGAFLLADVAGDGMTSLQDARQAMAAGAADPQRASLN